MGKTKIHIEKAKYELGDETSISFKKQCSRHNFSRGEQRAKRKAIQARDHYDKNNAS